MKMARIGLLIYIVIVLGLAFTGKLQGALWSIAIAIFLIGTGYLDMRDERIQMNKIARTFSRVSLLLGVVILVLGLIELFR
ncbi:hypothetical protein [Effusibacillus consociatus]|uniref:DUF3953 domain-containing protein n=1 Tax=Effusibacillus consociatus TaxID=1117041 RepID=A0ABV9QCC9_9BACL